MKKSEYFAAVELFIVFNNLVHAFNGEVNSWVPYPSFKEPETPEEVTATETALADAKDTLEKFQDVIKEWENEN
jgi:hypothetical protein